MLSCLWLIRCLANRVPQPAGTESYGSSHGSRRRSIGRAALIGILSQMVWLWAVLESQRRGVSPGTNALINATQPFVTAIALSVVLRERTSRRVLAGIVVAGIGLFLAVRDDLRGPGADARALAIPLISVASMTCAIVLQRATSRYSTAPDGHGPEHLLIQTAASAAVALLHLAIVGTGDIRWSVPFVATLAWIVLVSHIASYALFWYLVARTSPTRASALLLASPPTTIILSAILFGERLGTVEIVGTSIVVAGLALAQGRSVPDGRRAIAARRKCTRNPAARKCSQ